VKQITLEIGVQFRADRLPLTVREQDDAMRTVQEAALKLFKGATFSPAYGKQQSVLLRVQDVAAEFV
jgi:hypothetical protein